MKNGYYFFFSSHSDGVNKKVDNQIAEFNKYLKCEKVIIDKGRSLSIFEKALRVFPFAGLGYKFDKYLKMLDNSVFIYIRRTTVDKNLIKFLCDIKRKYPDCIIVWELPVYPYFKDSYCNNLKHFLYSAPFFIKDLLNRGKLCRAVDYIATFETEYETIFNIPTLKIRNGTDVDGIKPAVGIRDDTIDLVSVAMMSPHHGYERLINGMGTYYINGGKRNIIYHCIGYGGEEVMYKELVKQYNLENHVIFYGRKTGAELDKIYDRMDMAVASLGLYKKDIKVGSFIKTGEYLSKALPMITGSPVDVLDEPDFPYFIEFPNTPEALGMEKIIKFYDEKICAKPRDEIVFEMRAYAYRKVDMKVAMAEVTGVISKKS